MTKGMLIKNPSRCALQSRIIYKVAFQYAEFAHLLINNRTQDKHLLYSL